MNLVCLTMLITSLFNYNYHPNHQQLGVVDCISVKDYSPQNIICSGENQSNLTQISSFSTSFQTSGEARSHNVALASNNFSWLVIAPKQELSFNTLVGRRISSRGYKTAKVILDGQYVQGIGGGVCQVSSTLYNAWIRAGLEVKSAQAHSLPTSYCELGQDATVSDYIDLILVNNSNSPVVLNASINNKILTFEIYGASLTQNIQIESKIIKTLPPPPPSIEYVNSLDGYTDIKEDGESKYAVKTPAKLGYEVEVYQKKYDGDIIISKKLIRKTTYYQSSAKLLVLKPEFLSSQKS